jgi:AhpD family alkylhydroperoxidase
MLAAASHPGGLCRRTAEQNTPSSRPRGQAAAGKNGKETTMTARIDYLGNPLAMKLVKHINAASAVLRDSALPAATQELVKLRASQINGCGFCTDMHTKDALHAGESQQRLNLVAAWREATVFTEAERAALELAEQGTRIADAAGGVTDEVWANAAKHYDDDQLVALAGAIALINAYNRMNVIVQQPAGDYQPGQFG